MGNRVPAKSLMRYGFLSSIAPIGRGSMRDGPASLKDVEFFANIGTADLAELDRHCRWQEFDEGSVLVPAGKQIDRVFFLVHGELRSSFYTRVGKVVSMPQILQGGLVEGAALAHRSSLPYAIEAVKRSTVASFEASTFLGLAERSAQLMRALIAALVDSRESCVRQIIELATLSARARIHKELLRLCRDAQQPDGSSTIFYPPTHAEFANRVSTQREAVSRELSHLQALGIVLRREGTLYIPSVSKLGEIQVEFED
jgi:CRP/FNR family cyclic AMP-dependent transcriptional regulator